MKRVYFTPPAALLAVGAAALVAWFPTRAQTTAGATPGYSFPFKNRDGRLIARFSGISATPVSITQPTLLNVEQFRVETFHTNGAPELSGSAPQCLLNAATKDASSSGLLTVTQADGLFTLRGVGFAWNHESNRLVLSNQVHVTFRANSFESSPAKP